MVGGAVAGAGAAARTLLPLPLLLHVPVDELRQPTVRSFAMLTHVRGMGPVTAESSAACLASQAVPAMKLAAVGNTCLQFLHSAAS